MLSGFKHIVLIDSENVGQSWFQFIANPEPSTKYIVFRTAHSIPIPEVYHSALVKSVNQWEFIDCVTPGSNALDFQLVSWLGYLLAHFPDRKYTIFSSDTGYDPVIRFWANRGIKLNRQSPAKTKCSTPAGKKTRKQDPVRMALEQRFVYRGCTKETASIIADIVLAAQRITSKKRMSKVYQQMLAVLGQEIGVALYKSCRHDIKHFCNTGTLAY